MGAWDLVKTHPNTGRRALRILAQNVLADNDGEMHVDDLRNVLRFKGYDIKSNIKLKTMLNTLGLGLKEDGFMVFSRGKRK